MLFDEQNGAEVPLLVFPDKMIKGNIHLTCLSLLFIVIILLGTYLPQHKEAKQSHGTVRCRCCAPDPRWCPSWQSASTSRDVRVSELFQASSSLSQHQVKSSDNLARSCPNSKCVMLFWDNQFCYAAMHNWKTKLLLASLNFVQ